MPIGIHWCECFMDDRITGGKNKLCQKYFKHVLSLCRQNNVYRTNRTVNKRIVCSVCDQSFSSKYYIGVQVTNVHSCMVD